MLPSQGSALHRILQTSDYDKRSVSNSGHLEANFYPPISTPTLHPSLCTFPLKLTPSLYSSERLSFKRGFELQMKVGDLEPLRFRWFVTIPDVFHISCKLENSLSL